MKKLFLYIVFIPFMFSAYAQKEAAIWYFGENAGLDFNGGMSVPAPQ
ncbi:hypothetical protein [Maribacter sp. 4G9]|nr:hypothetical protein [Maribacter sp. 4G9]